jgi:hypothetical protein
MKRLLVVGVAVFILGGCVAPARSDSGYDERAAQTAKAALAEVQTARLAIRAAAAGKASARYLAVLLSSAETTVSDITGTFDSIQPPSTSSDDLRDALGKTLSDAEDTLAMLRIEVRRGHLDTLESTGAPLDASAAQLSAFVARLS